MICRMCALAGQWRKSEPDLAEQWHEKCLNPSTCSCQHRMTAVTVVDLEEKNVEDTPEA